ncbi:hypothetical protein, partial [Oceanimonas marisflavi]|uniref:hypothetical protein n=1 Tax=Oceanimonas marisflavi TaxID=2059724 RepID=UPI001E60CB88
LPSGPAVGQQRPCHSDYLPLSQGDSGFFQPDGFASFAGQTKKPARRPACINQDKVSHTNTQHYVPPSLVACCELSQEVRSGNKLGTSEQTRPCMLDDGILAIDGWLWEHLVLLHALPNA